MGTKTKPDDKTFLKLIDEAEALATLLRDKADEILLNCRTARANAGGVSTPPNNLHLEILAQSVLAKRQARLERSIQKKQNG